MQIAHPQLIQLMSSARVQSATRDTVQLARVLAAGRIPEGGVPPPPVRELRIVVAHRHRLVRQRTQACNRLHRVLHAHQLVPPVGRLGEALRSRQGGTNQTCRGGSAGVSSRI